MKRLKTLLFLVGIMLVGSFASSNLNTSARTIYTLKDKKVNDSTDTSLLNKMKNKVRNKLKSIENLSDTVKSQQNSIANKQ